MDWTGNGGDKAEKMNLLFTNHMENAIIGSAKLL